MSSDLIGEKNAELGHVEPNGTFVWNDHPKNELIAYRNDPSSNGSTEITGQKQEQDGELYRVSHSFKATIKIGDTPT